MADLTSTQHDTTGTTGNYPTWGTTTGENSPWNVEGFLPSNMFNSSEAINSDKRTFQMQQQSQAYNSAEAQKARDWEERMSNTAMQRSVADYQKAGFSALAALGGGSASTPNVAAAHSAASGSRGGARDSAGPTLLSGILNLVGGLITSGMSSAAKIAVSAANNATKSDIADRTIASKKAFMEAAASNSHSSSALKDAQATIANMWASEYFERGLGDGFYHGPNHRKR